MPRMFISQSWVGAAEYDEGDTYNGQQVGNRNQKSIGVHVTRSGDQWYANTKAYADDKPSKKPVQKRSAFSQACLSDNNLERLQRISESLDDDLESGVLSVEDWNYAKKNLQPRIDRAWKKIAKTRGWEEDEQEETGCIESAYQPQPTNRNNHQRNSFTSNVVCSNMVINSLSEGNIFKGLYLSCLKIWRTFK